MTTHLHLVPRSKNAWSYTSTPQYVFMAWCLVKRRDNFTFTSSCLVKVKSLRLAKYHALKAHGRWRYSSIHSLTSALDGGEWSASRPGRFTLRERTSGTHWIGSWVGRRAVLDAVVKREIPSFHRESNPRTPIIQPVAQRYTD
jgi:hypothetical protein